MKIVWKIVYSLVLLMGGFFLGAYWTFQTLRAERQAEQAGFTVLYDTSATLEADALGLLGAYLFGPVGGAIGKELGKQSSARWVIPGRVRPQIIGPPGEAHYIRLLPDGTKEGPFQPTAVTSPSP